MTAGSDTERERVAASAQRLAGAGQESASHDEVGPRFAELRKALQEYLAIEIARLKVSFWKAVFAVVSAALAVAVAIAFAVTAVVFVLSGLAGWLGEVTSKPYLGSLLAGLIGLFLVGAALLVARAVLMRKAGKTKGADQCG
jgi:hypothetical protein